MPGAGTAVLCLHGFMRNSRDFEEPAPWLAVGRRVIVPDLRGRGHSARMKTATDYDFNLLIGDMWVS
ncbi:alpha/beta fold hydrolase [Pseudomonas rhodesiae]|uniref:alpha/beta fold hydrolase n=1 Tax=Pseudomonas rhodesiae TaxID=76760 RepID=UPI0035A24FCB